MSFSVSPGARQTRSPWEVPKPQGFTSRDQFSRCRKASRLQDSKTQQDGPCFLQLVQGLRHLRPSPSRSTWRPLPSVLLLQGRVSRTLALTPRALPRPTHLRSSKPRSLKAESARLRTFSGAMFALWRHGCGSAPSREVRPRLSPASCEELPAQAPPLPWIPRPGHAPS